MKNYDVVVIGAGPAGSLFAYLAATAHLNVLLVEKSVSSRPYTQTLCLAPECQSLWQRLNLSNEFKPVARIPLKQIGIAFANGPTTEIPLPDDGPACHAIDRDTLNHWLLQLAIKAGAEYRPGRQCQQIDFARRLTIDDEEYRSKVVVAADGRNSWVARMTNLPLRKVPATKTAWITHMQVPHSGNHALYNFFAEGYLGILPTLQKDNDVFVVLNHNSTYAPQKFINEYFSGNEHLNWHSLAPATAYPTQVAKNNILFVGDAARLVEPFTGLGTYLALRSAEIAAQLTIATHLKGGWNELDERYMTAHTQLYQHMTWRNRLPNLLSKFPKLGKYAVKYAAKHPHKAWPYLPGAAASSLKNV